MLLWPSAHVISLLRLETICAEIGTALISVLESKLGLVLHVVDSLVEGVAWMLCRGAHCDCVTWGLDFCSCWYGYKIFDLASDANQCCMTCLVCLVEQGTTSFISIWCVCGTVRDSAAESGESGCAISSDGKYSNPYCWVISRGVALTKKVQSFTLTLVRHGRSARSIPESFSTEAQIGNMLLSYSYVYIFIRVYIYILIGMHRPVLLGYFNT